jgi:hypothetical protein
MSSMSSRPTRQSARDALEKIRGVLAWESCSEKSEAFQAAAAQMEREFASAKRRRVALRINPVSDEEDDVSDEENEEDEDEDEDNSDCDSESDAGSLRSAPSSADLFSDPGDSSEDEDALSEAESSDVAPAEDEVVVPVQDDLETEPAELDHV